jgi:hypothetical protein
MPSATDVRIDVKERKAGDLHCIPGCHFAWLVKNPLQSKMSEIACLHDLRLVRLEPSE